MNADKGPARSSTPSGTRNADDEPADSLGRPSATEAGPSGGALRSGGLTDFQAVFNDAPASLVVFTPDDYVIVAANEAYQRATLTDASRLLGRQVFDVFPSSGNPAIVDGQRRLRAALDEVARSREAGALPVIRYDIPNPEAEGGIEPRWWSQVVAPLLDEEGRVALFISQIEDVTEVIRQDGSCALVEGPTAANEVLREANLALMREVEVRRRAEARLRQTAEIDDYRLRLADTLRSHLDPATVMKQALRVLGEHLDADHVYFAEVDESSARYRIEQTYSRGGLTSLEGSHPMTDHGDLTDRLRRGETCVIEDTDFDAGLGAAARDMLKQRGFVSTVATSLVKDGRWLAILNVHSGTSRRWTPTEVALVTETAERSWSAFERARAQDQLKHDAETFQSMVKHVPFGMYSVDADLNIVQASQTALRTFGTDDLLGQGLRQALLTIWQEPFATEAHERFAHTLATGEPFVATNTVELRTDRPATEAYDWRLERITMPDGRNGVVCYYYDLTQQHRLERLLRDSRDRQSFLLELADELNGLNDPGDITLAACRHLAEVLEADRVLASHVEGGEHVLLASYDRGVPRLPGGRFPTGEFDVVFMGASEGLVAEPIDDVNTHPALGASDREVLAAHGVAALARVPLPDPTGGQPGSLTVHQSTRRTWSQLELDLAFEVAYRIQTAVERARAQADLTRLNTSLQDEVAARTEELRRSEAVKKAIEETMAEATWFRRSVVERLNSARIGSTGGEPAAQLTPREQQVLSRLASGRSDQTISKELGIAQRTVRNHVANIYAKLGVRSRSQAIVWAHERGVAT